MKRLRQSEQQSNARSRRERHRIECTLSRAWLRVNLPEVYLAIAREAEKRTGRKRVYGLPGLPEPNSNSGSSSNSSSSSRSNSNSHGKGEGNGGK
jgi:hypothetical protein